MKFGGCGIRAGAVSPMLTCCGASETVSSSTTHETGDSTSWVSWLTQISVDYDGAILGFAGGWSLSFRLLTESNVDWLFSLFLHFPNLPGKQLLHFVFLIEHRCTLNTKLCDYIYTGCFKWMNEGDTIFASSWSCPADQSAIFNSPVVKKIRIPSVCAGIDNNIFMRCTVVRSLCVYRNELLTHQTWSSMTWCRLPPYTPSHLLAS